MSNSVNSQESQVERKRHGYLTALLIVFCALVSIVNIFASHWIAGNLPNASNWASTGIIVMGLLGILVLSSLIAIWYWKKWGVYVYGITIIVVFFLNLMVGLGIGRSVLGLLGAILIIGFISQQWSDFE